MSLFSSIKPPNEHDLRTTFENLCATFADEKYRNGIDPNTMVDAINDIYLYVAGNKNMRIRLPAPMSNLDDRFGFMWPEGAKVSSRAPSNSSRVSVRKLSSNYTSQRAKDRAYSVTSSSRYSTKYIGFVEEDEDDGKRHVSRQTTQEKPSLSRTDTVTRRRSRSSKSSGSNTIKVGGQVMKPTPSMEKILTGDKYDAMDSYDPYIHNNSDDSKIYDTPAEHNEPLTPEPPVIRRRTKIAGFIDDD